MSFVIVNKHLISQWELQFIIILNLLLLNHFVNVRIYSRTFISNKISKIGIHVIRKINERLFKQGSYPKDSPFLIEICFVPSPWTNLWPQAIRSRLTTIASFRVSWLGLESNENFFLKKISLNFSSKIYRSPRFIIQAKLSPLSSFLSMRFFSYCRKPWTWAFLNLSCPGMNPPKGEL